MQGTIVRIHIIKSVSSGNGFFIYPHLALIQPERRNPMYFTNGDHRAFERLMRDKPGDQYDSGADGPYPECRSCRCHRPFWTYRFCLYQECPFTPGRVTAVGNGHPPKGGDVSP